jgi:deoxycytidylate deaminase
MCNIHNNIEIAAKIAREIDNNMRSCHCALICNKSKIKSIGINSRQTHPKAPKTKYGQLVHAEVAAIIGANREIFKNSCVMYVVRVGKANNKAMKLSKPCQYCQAAIIKAGIKNVYYSINENSIGHWDVRHNKWEVQNLNRQIKKL